MVVFTHQPFYSMLLFLNDDNESVESLYYPLYAAILFYWFPPNRLYKVCSQWTVPGTLKSIDLTVTFLVEHRDRPLLLVEIKPPSAFHEDGKRGDAIRQVMMRLGRTTYILDYMPFPQSGRGGWRAILWGPMAAGGVGRCVALRKKAPSGLPALNVGIPTLRPMFLGRLCGGLSRQLEVMLSNVSFSLPLAVVCFLKKQTVDGIHPKAEAMVTCL